MSAAGYDVIQLRRLPTARRFDLAYNAAHALSLAALRWHGYRPDERYIVFQALAHTLQMTPEEWRVLDQAHRRRNRFEYAGYGRGYKASGGNASRGTGSGAPASIARKSDMSASPLRVTPRPQSAYHVAIVKLRCARRDALPEPLAQAKEN
jgi:hypothetical protein